MLLDITTVDCSPREIYYKRLDEDQKIIASISTIYRIAKSEKLLTTRVKICPKNPLNRETPHLEATGINQVWSWDVSQILTLNRLIRFYLYVIIDIWSRLVIAWKLEEHENTDSAINLWKDGLASQKITGTGLVNHKDNGAIMTSKEMIAFVKNAEMVDSYSRAGVSDDNPYSESLFRTIKYFQEFPVFFENIEEGRIYFEKYFNDYNYNHRHSGIQFLTPIQRHSGEEEKILNIRNKTIEKFHKENPHRYAANKKVFVPIVAVKIN